jgi:hypothetical protein
MGHCRKWTKHNCHNPFLSNLLKVSLSSFCVSGDPPSWPLFLCTSRSFSIISAKRGSVFLSPVLRSACTQPRTLLNVLTKSEITRTDHENVRWCHRWTEWHLAEILCLKHLWGCAIMRQRCRPRFTSFSFIYENVVSGIYTFLLSYFWSVAGGFFQPPYG